MGNWLLLLPRIQQSRKLPLKELLPPPLLLLLMSFSLSVTSLGNLFICFYINENTVPKFHTKKSCFYLFDIDYYFSDHGCRQALMLKIFFDLFLIEYSSGLNEI